MDNTVKILDPITGQWVTITTEPAPAEPTPQEGE